jgi:phage protein U
MTSLPLYQLGSFQFNLPNGSPQTVDRNDAYRWEQQDRLLREPANQWLGPGTKEITLDGVLYPGFSGRQGTMQTLRDMAERGEPYMLNDGRGRVLGRWCIVSIREGRSLFVAGGDARQIDFSIRLVRYGEDNPGAKGSPLSVTALVKAAATPTTNFTAAGSAFNSLDWAQSFQWQGLTQQATQQAGFNLGQLAAIGGTGTTPGSQVNTVLRTFGLNGFTPQAAIGWESLGFDPVNIAQAFATGRGAAAMAAVLEPLRVLGIDSLTAAGVVPPQDANAMRSLLQRAATLGSILDIDPAVTNVVRELATLRAPFVDDLFDPGVFFE